MKKRVNKLFFLMTAGALIFGACEKDLNNGMDMQGIGIKDGTDCVNVGFDPEFPYMGLNGPDGDVITEIQRSLTGYDYPIPWQIYNFKVQGNGSEYVSFCGNYGSYAVGNLEQVVNLDVADKDEIVGVLNYINGRYGSINTWTVQSGAAIDDPEQNTKLISQIAIWLIIGKGLEGVELIGCPNLNAAVQDALTNGKTTKGNIDIYFLVGIDYPNDIDGIQPQIVPVGCKEELKGDIKIAKTVDGIEINAWAKKAGKNIASLISFNLYTTNADGEKAVKVNTTPVYPDANGIITFSGLSSGVYIVEEVLSSAGKLVFEKAPDMKIEIKGGVQIDASIDFDYDVDYTIINGYGSGYTLGYPGLNNTGDVFYIGVSNSVTGATYASFCANAGSTNFDEGPGRYMITERFDTQTDYINFVKAYNYIEDNYEDLNLYRPITQIITWYLLGAIEIPSAEFDNINWGAVAAGTGTIKPVPNAKAIVEDVVANYQSHSGLGKIIDVVYMVSKYNPNIVTAQPQLVPIYGAPGFNNREKPKCTESYGTVTFTAFGNVPNIVASLNPKNGNPQFPASYNANGVVYNSNHFCFAKFCRSDLVDGQKVHFVNGNKFDIVGTGLVQLVDGNIVLTIYGFVKGEFGLMAFNKPMTDKFPKNGNIHSQKEADLKKELGATTGFNHNNVLTVPCPEGNTIYLYFHAGALTFYR